MDAKLRELERQANDDPQAALRLNHELKRLIHDQWQAVKCPQGFGGSDYPHSTFGCTTCDGYGWLRINVMELNEHKKALRGSSHSLGPSPIAPAFVGMGAGVSPSGGIR